MKTTRTPAFAKASAGRQNLIAAALVSALAFLTTALGAGKWGAGPSVVALRQEHGFTYGILANHIWSYEGWGPQNVNATFLQPFVGYTTKTFTTFTVNTESTYDWQGHQWTAPMNFMVQQLVKIGRQPVAFLVGYRYFADRPAGGPDWGLRFAITLLFPKRMN